MSGDGAESELEAGPDGPDGADDGRPSGDEPGGEEGLGFWTHTMPPIKRGPSLLNQIEDEFDGRVADPGSNLLAPTALSPLAPLPLHHAPPGAPSHEQQQQYYHQHQQQQQQHAAAAAVAHTQLPGRCGEVRGGAAGSGGCANGGGYGSWAPRAPADAAAGGLGVLTTAAAAAPAVPEGACGGAQPSANAEDPPPQFHHRAPDGCAGGYGGAGGGGCCAGGIVGGGVPTIAPNPSEASLFLDVLDHAEPSAAGPALRRDNSIVARAAQTGRVPAGSSVDEAVDEFK